MSNHRITNLIAAGVIGAAGFATLAILPATHAGAATVAVRHAEDGARRDSAMGSQRENSRDTRTDKSIDLAGYSKDTRSTPDTRSDSGSVQHDVTGESQSALYDHTKSLLAATHTGATTRPANVNINAKCSGSSVANLQVQREDTGKLSVDFGVDMVRHQAGVPWKVTLSDNGSLFVNTTVKTISDGSFSVSPVINPKSGINTIVGKAVNVGTHETCTIKGSL